MFIEFKGSCRRVSEDRVWQRGQDGWSHLIEAGELELEGGKCFGL